MRFFFHFQRIFDVDLVARRPAAAGDVQEQLDRRAVRELVVLERARREVAAAGQRRWRSAGMKGLVFDDVLELTGGQRAVHI